MKLVFINTLKAPWGGSEELWTLAAAAAVKSGHQVTILTYSVENAHHRFEELKELGVNILYRRIVRHFSVPPLHKRLINRARKLLKKEKYDPWLPFQKIIALNPDCIVINQTGTYNISWDEDVQRLLKEANVPYFLIEHFNTETGSVIYDSILKTRPIFNGARKMYFVAQRNLDVTQRQLATTLSNAELIRNPTNLRKNEKISWPSLDTISMACVARLDCNYKGQDILLETLSQPVWKTREWHLSFYGKGQDEQYLRELISFYNLNSNVSLKGHLDDVAEIWRTNHILVLPSISEGTPISLVEAMVSGRPAIVTDVGGNASLIQEDSTGFVADAPTVRLLSSTLERAWVKRSNWRQMGEKAHETAMKLISRNPAIELVEKIIDSL